MISKKKIQSNDLRVIKTKKIIKESFMQLIEEKGYSKVSISEITERAMINRNTFYLHYCDKEDLVDKILEENFKNFQKSVAVFILRYNTRISNNIKDNIAETVSDTIDILLADIEFYRIIVMDPGLSGYLTKVKNNIKILMAPNFNTTVENKIIFDFIFDGVFGVLIEWIKKDYATKSEIVETLSNLLSSGWTYLKI